jgi:hypothetical protein
MIECLHRPRYKFACFSHAISVTNSVFQPKWVPSQMHTSAPARSPDPTVVSVEVHRHPTRNHRHARLLLRAEQCCLFTLLSAKYCCVTKETQQYTIHCCSSANVIEPREPHTCNNIYILYIHLQTISLLKHVFELKFLMRRQWDKLPHSDLHRKLV